MRMSKQAELEKAVSALQNCLQQAIDDIRNKGPLVLSFEKIKKMLDDLKTHLRNVDSWECTDSPEDKFKKLNDYISGIIFGPKNQQPSNIGDNFIKESIEDIKGALLPQRISKEWKEQKVEEKIFGDPTMANLQASYHNLEKHELRVCFLYFSIFPENAVIQKRPLIYWWISEGLVSTEQEGEAIFEELIQRGLIQAHLGKPIPVVNACTMHPWIRHLAISLAKTAELFNFDSCGTPLYGALRSRHACLVLDGPDNQHSPAPGAKEENLLTVFNVSEQYLSFKRDWLPKLKKIVVLQLGRWHSSLTHHIEVENEDFLNGLGAQKHLKYLSLRGISRITTLPSSIVELFNLEILDLKACHNLEGLCFDIGQLRKLTHLDISDCPLLQSMPKGIEKLSSLQVLKGFMIGNSRATSCRIGHLTKLTNLRRLGIYIGSEAVVQDEDLNKLEEDFKKVKEIKSLRCLSIWWGVKPRKPEEAADKRSNTILSFPQGLEKLDLRGIPDQQLLEELKPSTMNKLKKLYIRGGVLDSLEKLYIQGGVLDSLAVGESDKWKVEILRLKYLKNFKIEWEKVRMAFPHLSYLEVKCDEKDQSNEQVEFNIDVVLESKTEIENYKEKIKSEDKHKDDVTSAKNEKSEEKGKKVEDKSNKYVLIESDRVIVPNKAVVFEKGATSKS